MPSNKSRMAKSALERSKREGPKRMMAEVEAYTQLKKLASLSEDEKWGNGAPDRWFRVF